MLQWLKKKRARRQTARFLYGSIVTAARQPIFYSQWGAPDTVAGRLEMILLHLALAERRLGQEGKPGLLLARAVSEAFVTELDDQMREMTFGDLAVPREVKRAAAALFDRWRALSAALSQSEEALHAALRAQLAYLNPHVLLDLARLAGYLRAAAQAIDAQSTDEILAGKFAWPVVPANGSQKEPIR